MGGYSLAGSNATEPSRGGGHIVVGGVVPYHPDKGILDNMTGPPVDRTTHAPHVVDETPILVYVLVPIGSLLLIILVSFLVVFILRKSRLDKLRHHLMPLYNFDPAEEEGDWESELLEEEKEKQMTRLVMSPSPTGGPKLKFTDSLDV